MGNDTKQPVKQEITGFGPGRWSAIAKVRQLCKDNGLKVEFVKCTDCTPAPGAEPCFQAVAIAVPIPPSGRT